MSFGSNIKLNPLITKCVIPKQFIFKSGVCDVSVQTIGYELWSIFWYSLHFIQIILVIFLISDSYDSIYFTQVYHVIYAIDHV